MVKFGEQIQNGTSGILGRTQQLKTNNLVSQQKADQQQQINEAQSKLSQAQSIDEYESIYSTLTALQRSAFPSPEELRSQQEAKRQESLGKTKNRIEDLYTQSTEEQSRFQRRQESGNQISSYEQRSYEDKLSDIGNEIGALQEALGKLESGELISYSDILGYAGDKVNYYQNIRESRRSNQRVQEQAVKDLEKRNKEAQAQGFNFSGTIQESYANPRTGKVKSEGSSYFLGGAEVSGQQFSKKYDVYQKPSGAQLIVPRGTDFSKLTPKQQESLFPEEVAQAKAQEAQRLQDFKSKVEGFSSSTVTSSNQKLQSVKENAYIDERPDGSGILPRLRSEFQQKVIPKLNDFFTKLFGTEKASNQETIFSPTLSRPFPPSPERNKLPFAKAPPLIVNAEGKDVSPNRVGVTIAPPMPEQDYYKRYIPEVFSATGATIFALGSSEGRSKIAQGIKGVFSGVVQGLTRFIPIVEPRNQNTYEVPNEVEIQSGAFGTPKVSITTYPKPLLKTPVPTRPPKYEPSDFGFGKTTLPYFGEKTHENPEILPPGFFQSPFVPGVPDGKNPYPNGIPNFNSATLTGQAISNQNSSESQKSFFTKFFQTTGDVLSGLFLKSTVGLGLRGYNSGEPTAFTGTELREMQQQALDKSTFFGFSRAQLVGRESDYSNPFSKLFGFGLTPSLIDISGTQLAGYKLSRDIRESGEQAINQRNTDVQNIQAGTGQLTQIDTRVNDLNQQVKSGTIKPEDAQIRFNQIEQERLAVFQDLAQKGIRTTVETTPEGQLSFSFTSKSIQADLAPASVKLLREATPIGKAQLITGGLATEALEFSTFGLIGGGSGATAKIGLFVSKFPKAIQTTLILGGIGVTLGKIGYSGYKGIETGQKAGIGKVGGFALGAGIPATQLTALGLGSYVGNKLYTESIIQKLRRGGFTKPVQETGNVNGEEVKYPSQGRAGRTKFKAGDEQFTEVVQEDKLQTKIPGTDIKYDTEGSMKGSFQGDTGLTKGYSETTITGKDAGSFRNQNIPQRAFYVDREGQTGIVTITKAKGGVEVNEFRSSAVLKDIKILGETPEGGKTIFLDVNRVTEKLGEPIFVKEGSLSEESVKSILRSKIDLNRLFTPFEGEDTVYSIGRIQQVVAISPKRSISESFDFGSSAVKVISENDQFQTFASIGSSRTARTDALQGIINQIMKDQGAAIFKKGLLLDKGGEILGSRSLGQSTNLFEPSSTFTVPPSIFGQDTGFVTVSPVSSQLESTIRSAIGSNALVGTATLLGLASLNQSRYNQDISQKSFSLQLQKFETVQIQQPVQKNIPQPRHIQTLQQLLQTQQQQIPTTPGFGAPPTRNPNFNLPGFPDLKLAFFETVRKKIRAKKSKREFSYTQDFESKILETSPIRVSPEKARKLAFRINTGFESRPPIIVTNKVNKKLKRLLSQ